MCIHIHIKRPEQRTFTEYRTGKYVYTHTHLTPGISIIFGRPSVPNALRAEDHGSNSTRLRRASLTLTLCRPHWFSHVRCLERVCLRDPGNFRGGTSFDFHLHIKTLLCLSPFMLQREFVTLSAVALITLHCSRRLDGGARRGYRPPP